MTGRHSQVRRPAASRPSARESAGYPAQSRDRKAPQPRPTTAPGQRAARPQDRGERQPRPQNPSRRPANRDGADRPQRVANRPSARGTRPKAIASGASVSMARLAVAAAAGAVLLLAAFLILGRCTPQPAPDAPGNDTAPSATSDNGDAPSDPEPNREALVELLGQEEADKLLAQAESNDDARWIASHLGEYDFEGPEVKYKILKLAADEPASLAYVRDFPALSPPRTRPMTRLWP